MGLTANGNAARFMFRVRLCDFVIPAFLNHKTTRNKKRRAKPAAKLSIIDYPFSTNYVPVSQLVMYSSISGVRMSILTPIACSLSEAIS